MLSEVLGSGSSGQDRRVTRLCGTCASKVAVGSRYLARRSLMPSYGVNAKIPFETTAPSMEGQGSPSAVDVKFLDIG